VINRRKGFFGDQPIWTGMMHRALGEDERISVKAFYDGLEYE